MQYFFLPPIYGPKSFEPCGVLWNVALWHSHWRHFLRVRPTFAISLVGYYGIPFHKLQSQLNKLFCLDLFTLNMKRKILICRFFSLTNIHYPPVIWEAGLSAMNVMNIHFLFHCYCWLEILNQLIEQISHVFPTFQYFSIGTSPDFDHQQSVIIGPGRLTNHKINSV